MSVTIYGNINYEISDDEFERFSNEVYSLEELMGVLFKMNLILKYSFTSIYTKLRNEIGVRLFNDNYSLIKLNEIYTIKELVVLYRYKTSDCLNLK